ncbi:chymotrypsinogen B-like protein [Dinothrombium tinctorium]|uniref:Chymotrypsinogen B-like protein n=1 Tax=Dinothrombium tinctorium TaxID=1965070 RepID=A0A443Q6G4_9ACAR|nr:chymotrypsinogen B-like protein [Dinothrombium tinctorium]
MRLQTFGTHCTWENDIGMIVIASDVIDYDFDDVEEICLPEDNLNTDGQVMRVAGWDIAAYALSGFVSDGDSGGPLMLYRDGSWAIVGIIREHFVNNITQVCNPSCPSIYTRVSRHLGWINGVIDDNTFENTLPLPFPDNDQESTLNGSHSNYQMDDENAEFFLELNENLRLLEAYLRKNKHDELK